MTLGDRYTENIESIYKVSINLVIETLIDGYEKGMQQQQSATGAGSSNETRNAASSSSQDPS